MKKKKKKQMTKNTCAIQESNANHSIYYGFFASVYKEYDES